MGTFYGDISKVLAEYDQDHGQQHLKTLLQSLINPELTVTKQNDLIRE